MTPKFLDLMVRHAFMKSILGACISKTFMIRKIFVEKHPFFWNKTSFSSPDPCGLCSGKKHACIPGAPAAFIEAGRRSRNPFGIGRRGRVPRFHEIWNSLARKTSQLSGLKKGPEVGGLYINYLISYYWGLFHKPS